MPWDATGIQCLQVVVKALKCDNQQCLRVIVVVQLLWEVIKQPDDPLVDVQMWTNDHNLDIATRWQPAKVLASRSFNDSRK